jgi:CelD/BcsL family acetyltransferase involved in cellulose biosynthesis
VEVWTRGAMQTTVVELPHVSGELIEAWKDLACRAAEPNAFFEAEFVLAAARHLKSSSVYLAVFVEDGILKAALPVYSNRLWRGRGPRVVRSWVHRYCYLGTPMLDADQPLGALEGLLDELNHWSGRQRILAFALLGTGGPVESALNQATSTLRHEPVIGHSFERAVLYQDENGSALGGRVRREVSRLGRRLEREMGAPAVIVERSGEPAAIDDFLELEASGWKGANGTAMASTPEHAQFFRDVCADFARKGCLQLRSLEVSGRPVATKCNLISGNAVFCFKSAYDERYASSSPGFQLEVHDMECFAVEGRLWEDSCTDPYNSMINRLWPGRRTLANVLVPPSRSTKAVLRPILALRKWSKEPRTASEVADEFTTRH